MVLTEGKVMWSVSVPVASLRSLPLVQAVGLRVGKTEKGVEVLESPEETLVVRVSLS